MTRTFHPPHAWLASVAIACTAGCAAPAYEAPRVDSAPTTQAIKKLPRKTTGERVAVTIYEFRSSLSETTARGATDMFKTALVQSGQFTVVERSRLNEGVAREKQLQQAGAASGKAGQTVLRGAAYIFEGVVSEANASESQRSSQVGIGGLQVGSGSNRDSIAIDVRIVDAANGDIVDAITVRKTLKSKSSQVAGVGALLGTVLASQGKSSAYVPDVQSQSQTREGTDQALREAMNQAVIELTKRFAP